MNRFGQNGYADYAAPQGRVEEVWKDTRPLSEIFPHGVPIPVGVRTTFTPMPRRSNMEEQLELHEGQIVLVEKLNHESRWCFGRLLEVPSFKPGWFPASHCAPLPTITVPSVAPRGLSGDGIMQPAPTAGIGVAFALAGPHRLIVAVLQPGGHLPTMLSTPYDATFQMNSSSCIGDLCWFDRYCDLALQELRSLSNGSRRTFHHLVWLSLMIDSIVGFDLQGGQQ